MQNDAIDYLKIFTSLTIFKAFCSGVHRYKVNQMASSHYETESTLAVLMKIQMQFNFLLLHSTLFFKQWDNVSEMGQFNLFLMMSTSLFAMTLLLTDYRWLLKIYRYENHILREDYPIFEFLGIQIFMMFGCALLITIQWFTIPILSDLMHQLLCIYKIPQIIKCHQNNQMPNITYFCFLEDYCILIFFSYYRGCPSNIFKLQENLGICISVTVFICIQQCILLYQFHIKPQLYYNKSQVKDFAKQIREQNIYSTFDDLVMNTNVECAICLQGIEITNSSQIQLDSQDSIVLTLCSHKFHESCLISWLQVKKQCPVCRHQF
ncbi:unnamed protein product (macronuclear) [Paramecium tetraurelia]|uniref:RING-type E3 ubiquitin transferase n=1 Tax=Paramecium tetraurelia TaxID=5888 RepID=A0BXX1_PARTE|nr:uncharacterized protein GSPATT00033241001 [Paramecium tetraurelia]CAK63388.1 unnamed protein product [Paramecium tetraurelia]|eukprot:XP_001430786.1 hypothetical protein (macronuclear) [Paramecium tetraurelia strain d4-2]